jgi:hypothetical protein
MGRGLQLIFTLFPRFNDGRRARQQSTITEKKKKNRLT